MVVLLGRKERNERQAGQNRISKMKKSGGEARVELAPRSKPRILCRAPGTRFTYNIESKWAPRVLQCLNKK